VQATACAVAGVSDRATAGNGPTGSGGLRVPARSCPLVRTGRGWLRSAGRTLDSAAEWLFGLITIVAGLAVVATVPILQLLSLGYLLEAAARVAKTGHVAAGLIGVRKAARIGTIVLGGWLLVFPVRLAASMRTSARLIDPRAPATTAWSAAVAAGAVMAVWWFAAACDRGGMARHFLWPRPVRFLGRLFRRGSYTVARDAVWDQWTQLHLPFFFWLGMRGFIGGLLWLIVPVTLLAAGRDAPLVGLVGGLLLAVVVVPLPLLQVRMAVENRFRAVFELGAVRRAYARAPIASALAIALVLITAVPLYLLKIELVPREAAWLPSLLFVVSIWPARLATGWAVARSARHEAAGHWATQWLGRGLLVPLAGVYVLIVYSTQYLAWYGVASLYEQHAFLVPVPFLNR